MQVDTGEKCSSVIVNRFSLLTVTRLFLYSSHWSLPSSSFHPRTLLFTRPKKLGCRPHYRITRVQIWANVAVIRRKNLVLCFFDSVQTCNHFFSTSPGWEVLAEEEEEQRGCQTLTWCPQVKGEPDHGPGSFPGAWECSVEDGGGRATEGVRPLQERCRPLRSQIWTTVRQQTNQICETVNGHL